MKRLLTLVVVTLCTFAAEAKSYRIEDIANVQLADRTCFVTNPDAILSQDAVQRLDSICYSLREQGLAEIAIVAIEDIAEGDVFSFGFELFERWGVGNDKLDNGLGILLVENKHEIRFFTGYGLEGVLPDALCTNIQQKYMLPHFRQGDYSAGMVAGVSAVDKLLVEGELPVAEYDDNEGEIGALIFVIFCICLPILIFLIAEYRKMRCPKCKRHKLHLVGSTIMSQQNKPSHILETYRCAHCGHEQTKVKPYDDNSNNHRGGGGMWIFPMGGSGGFGSGGGFGGGGFGGGSFGGGGGGSRW